MLPDGGSGEEGKDDETDGDRVRSIPLPSGQSPSTSVGEQISDQDRELDLLLMRISPWVSKIRAKRVICPFGNLSKSIGITHEWYSRAFGSGVPCGLGSNI